MSIAYTHAKEIKEIVGAIYGLTMILEADGVRDACDGETSVFGPYELGTINSAIKHLATQADFLAESIEEEEERLAELSAQRDDREGRA